MDELNVDQIELLQQLQKATMEANQREKEYNEDGCRSSGVELMVAKEKLSKLLGSAPQEVLKAYNRWLKP